MVKPQKPHPYDWDKLLKQRYDNCNHVQLIRQDGSEAFCDECGNPICKKCGLCVEVMN